MRTVTLPEKHFEYWREALSPDLFRLINNVNYATLGSPWRVRLKITMERLRWWHWNKTVVCRYQVLRWIRDNEYELNDECGEWCDRSTVVAFFTRRMRRVVRPQYGGGILYEKELK